MMFKSGGAVVKRGYVSNEIAMAATKYNLRLIIALARTLVTTSGFNAEAAGCGAARACTRESVNGCIRPCAQADSSAYKKINIRRERWSAAKDSPQM